MLTQLERAFSQGPVSQNHASQNKQEIILLYIHHLQLGQLTLSPLESSPLGNCTVLASESEVLAEVTNY